MIDDYSLWLEFTVYIKILYKRLNCVVLYVIAYRVRNAKYNCMSEVISYKQNITYNLH